MQFYTRRAAAVKPARYYNCCKFDAGVQEMREIILNTEIHKFDSCAEFAREFALGGDDLLFTIRPLYERCFAPLSLGVKTLFFEDFGNGEPTDVMTDEIIREASRAGFKRLVAAGGGSVIDIAKAVAVSRGRTTDELYAAAPDLARESGLVIVPSTCGTGSEVTNISIINRTRLGTKMGLVSPALFADSAALVPELLEELPFGAFAASAIDALVHAVESALSPRATATSKLLSYRAAEMIISRFAEIKRLGRESRTPLLADFLLASNYAGIAFGTAGCAAVHALSYPLGGAYHVPHGESNYAVFTGVMKNYLEIKSDGEIEKMMNFIAGLLRVEKARAWEALEELLDAMLPKKPLRAYGVAPEELPRFARSVMETQKRLMNNNFVPLDERRVLKIYHELL